MATTSASPPPDLTSLSTTTDASSPALLTPTTTTNLDTPPHPGTPTLTTPTLSTQPAPIAQTSQTSQPSQPPTGPSTSSSTSPSSSSFQFPPHHAFPPFYTLQPNSQTLLRQLSLWSTLILSYSSSQNPPIFKLQTSTAASSSPLFNNKSINRSLDPLAVRKVVDYMTTSEGGAVAEWVLPSSKSGGGGGGSGGGGGRRDRSLKDEEKTVAWLWWKRPEEWGESIYRWVDETGQKGSVLTVYELRESEGVAREGWVGMDEDMFRRCLEGLVKKGRCQIFEGQGGDGAGVKFF